MIVSDLAHLPTQLKTNTAFDQAIEFLRQERWRGKPDGKIGIDGDTVFALLQSYTTLLPENTVKYEGHHKYIDIQYVVEGKETIYWRHAPELAPTTPYDPAKDVWFSYAPTIDAIPVTLLPGQLVVLFPTDAHAATHCAGDPVHVRKIVIKVAV
ncbi:evolved beta-galactosidase subunit beta [Anaerolineae bacterium]|nr:evolved beta-galactosidase subunit beta [Anaerolineae bacterium]